MVLASKRAIEKRTENYTFQIYLYLHPSTDSIFVRSVWNEANVCLILIGYVSTAGALF